VGEALASHRVNESVEVFASLAEVAFGGEILFRREGG
jgi:hypothetical protein